MADLIADLLAKFKGELIRDTLSERDSCHSSRLCDTHKERRATFFGTVVLELPWGRLSCLEDELRDLGRFTTSSLSAYDRHHKVFNVFHDLELVQYDGKLRLLRLLTYRSWLIDLSSFLGWSIGVKDFLIEVVDECNLVVVCHHLFPQVVIGVVLSIPIVLFSPLEKERGYFVL